MIDRFSRWLDYEVKAHERVLASFSTVPEARRSEPAFTKAVDLFAHILAARRLWLSRFGYADAPAELFPSNASYESLAMLHEGTYRLWRQWLDQADEDMLIRSFRYDAVGGGSFESTYEEVLTQLFGHSWYHRGQIATLIRACGGEPAITDYIYFTRRRVGG